MPIPIYTIKDLHFLLCWIAKNQDGMWLDFTFYLLVLEMSLDSLSSFMVIIG